MRLVVLDRDGVINYDSDAYIKSPAEWRPIPGSLEAIASLHRAGFTVTVATNQAGIARGLFDIAALEAIHKKMLAAVEAAGGALAGIFYCPHGPADHCDCRKPQPGLLHQIAARLGTRLENVPMVGDSWRDIEAARRVGARPILVRTGNGELTLQQQTLPGGVEAYADLAAAAAQLIRERVA